MDPRYLLHRLGPGPVRELAERNVTKLRRRLAGVEKRLVTLEPAGAVRGEVLFSYILDALLEPDAPPASTHTHFWESATMARTFADAGYRVDAVAWTNDAFEPAKDYDVVVDVRTNLERWAPRLAPETVKVLHIDTSHWSVNNPAQERRLAELRARRGVALRPVKRLPENRAIEVADCATILGNAFTESTYAFAGKPIFRIPISVPFTYPWTESKDFAAVRRRFLWFGSGGLVHKGLDLVLEAFAGLPDVRLTVCGPVGRERDFEREYFRELYRTPNIRTLGWVDVAPASFVELAREHLALVYPSCAEGGGSSVLTCMHAGLIPVINDEVSVDLDPAWGVRLAGTSIGELRDAIRHLAGRDSAQLERMARGARDFARERHTRERFAEGYRGFVASLVDGSWQRTPHPIPLPAGERGHEVG